MRTATLVIVGNFAQALGACAEHHILTAKSVLEDPIGIYLESVQRVGRANNGRCRCLTRVRVDANSFGAEISAWLNETRLGGNCLETGALLHVQLLPETA